MNCGANKIAILLVLIFAALFSGCASQERALKATSALYQTSPAASTTLKYSPSFFVKRNNELFNRIGTPSVRLKKDAHSEIFVDPTHATIFFDTQAFSTGINQYKNLVFRVHFERVPFGLTKLNLTTGNNPGILIIFTVNEKEELLLVTTVHTCGCFLAFLPTDKLDRASYPPGWPDKIQQAFGYSLPSQLEITRAKDKAELVFTLESETHRISDVMVAEGEFDSSIVAMVPLEMLPMSTLYTLPYEGRTESFFEMDGSREGYVKNNTKWLEKLLISWWAFDLKVGEDKAYLGGDSTDTVLYTSLKFWARKYSNLKNFPRFLSYWGWKL